MSVHYWLVLHPDISRPIGGAKQMHRLAESIVHCGRKATIIQDSSEFHPGWFESKVNSISHQDWIKLRDRGLNHSNNVLIFPETYLTAIDGYSLNLPSVIFNQNASYTFGLSGNDRFLNPSYVFSSYRQPSIKHVLCVSEYDYRFLSEFVVADPQCVSLIVNGLEDCLSSPLPNKISQIAYMPRKNKLDSSIVSALISERPSLKSWSLKSISGLPHSHVIDIMRSSLLFLSFGHPEGFGLPVAEAMACGCAVVGYSGLGGRELFDHASQFSMSEEIAFGDWTGFIDAIEDFHFSYIKESQLVLRRLELLSRDIYSKYSMDAMRSSVLTALSKIESSL